MTQGAAVVTGGAGFIGSHLVEHLLGLGRAVTVVDDLSTGRLENLAAVQAHANLRLLQADAGQTLSEPGFLDHADEVYHLAATVGVKRVVDDPAGMIQNNLTDTARVLHACADAAAPPRVLLASTSEVYGRSTDLPLREDGDLLFGPTSASRWAYGMSKALAEHAAVALGRQRGLAVVAVRFFNVVGPRQVGTYGMVTPRFVAKAVQGQPLELYGNGQQSRTFCDVSDIVAALPELLACPQAAGLAVNLGSDRPITIEALAALILHRARAAGALGASEGQTRRVAYEAVYGEGFEDTPSRLPHLGRARGLIGFDPQTTLEQTVDRLIRLELDARTPLPDHPTR
ncbi:MAG: NAD-dependent epimerase/dehydratase family protein [Planctomycetota bacterium]